MTPKTDFYQLLGQRVKVICGALKGYRGAIKDAVDHGVIIELDAHLVSGMSGSTGQLFLWDQFAFL